MVPFVNPIFSDPPSLSYTTLSFTAKGIDPRAIAFPEIEVVPNENSLGASTVAAPALYPVPPT